MNYIDLFSGAGGFHLGLLEAGFVFDNVFYSEIDKYAESVYERKFPDAKKLGPIESVRPEELPKIDLITFGFPCQDLSIAGHRGGIGADRSGLFFEAARIIEAKKPPYFIFENVPGLFSSREGRDFEVVLKTIADLGYDGQWQVLNTRWFLPQNRERIYFVGHLRTGRRPEVFPIGEGCGDADKKGQGFKAGLWANAVDSSYHKGPGGKRTMIKIDENPRLRQIGMIGDNSMGNRVYDTDGVSKTLAGGGGRGAKTGLYAIKGDLLTRNNPERQNGISETMFALRTAVQHGVSESHGIRRLTPLETERLQGFDDNFTKFGHGGREISDTQRYRMMGNAVSVPVVAAVGERLLPYCINELTGHEE